MPSDLDIDLLRAFATVHQAGGFSQAAEILGRSQPAISLQIKRLEERVGGQLFERTSTRGVPLTTGRPDPDGLCPPDHRAA